MAGRERCTMTPDEIERGLRDLGLADDATRRSLQRLADLSPAPLQPSYETATVAHTTEQTARVADAELEPGS
jgi:hypothetical protein